MLNKVSLRYLILFIYSKLSNFTHKNIRFNLKNKYIVDKLFISILRILYTKKYTKKYNYEDHEKMRLGFIGCFSGLLSFTEDLFKKYPKESLDLYLYDEGYNNIYMKQYSDFSNYYQISQSTDIFSSYENLVKQIEIDSLNYLIIINRDKLYYLNMINEIKINFPELKILAINTGGHLTFNNKIQIQGVGQINNGYILSKNKLRDLKGNLVFNSIDVHDDLFHYDISDIKMISNEKNKKLSNKSMVFTGSFYKLSHPIFLNVCKEILSRDNNYKFFFYGKGDKLILNKIMNFFEKNGLDGQVFYKGIYTKLKNENGKYVDDSWEEAKKIIANASVFLNSFPIGGASATMEAFALNIPVLTMISDNKDLTSYYIPSITPRSAICKNEQEYIEKALILLNDTNSILKQNILKEQDCILKEMASEEKFWERLLSTIKKTYES